jgi:hypothetical protein
VNGPLHSSALVSAMANGAITERLKIIWKLCHSQQSEECAVPRSSLLIFVRVPLRQGATALSAPR